MKKKLTIQIEIRQERLDSVNVQYNAQRKQIESEDIKKRKQRNDIVRPTTKKKKPPSRKHGQKETSLRIYVRAPVCVWVMAISVILNQIECEIVLPFVR